MLKHCNEQDYIAVQSNSAKEAKIVYLTMVDSLALIAKKFKRMTKLETADASNRHGDKLSHEVVSLISRIRILLHEKVEQMVLLNPHELRREDMKQKHYKQVEVFLLSLVLDQGLAPLGEYSFDEIMLKIWDQSRYDTKTPQNDVFHVNTGKSLFVQLIQNVRAYFFNRNADLGSPDIQFLVRSGKPSKSKAPPYRDTIIHGLLNGFKKPIDFTQVLIE